MRVGIAGIGFMGWIHWLAWEKVDGADVVAIEGQVATTDDFLDVSQPELAIGEPRREMGRVQTHQLARRRRSFGT